MVTELSSISASQQRRRKLLRKNLKQFKLRLPKPYNTHVRNPMCSTFPTEVSCTFYDIGAGGAPQDHNGFCVLTQNIINEKMYFLFWFWYLILGIISLLWFAFRLTTILSPQIRFYLLYSKVASIDSSSSLICWPGSSSIWFWSGEPSEGYLGTSSTRRLVCFISTQVRLTNSRSKQFWF